MEAIIELAASGKLISNCMKVKEKSDFRTIIYPELVRLLPHEKFACGIVRMSDMQVLEHLNFGFGLHALDRGRMNQCPVLKSWTQHRRPVIVGEQVARPVIPYIQIRDFLAQQNLSNIAVHGMADPNLEIASYFYFADLEYCRDRESALLELVVPHLHYALSNAEDFGKKPLKRNLSERENQVLQWICIGKSNIEIAEILGISPWTVKIHVKNVLDKLNASNRGHAVAKGIALGLVTVS